MPVLYGTRRSRASRNLWLQEEAGFPMELRPVWQAYRLDDPQAEGAPMNTLTPAFRAMWPQGGIPVLEDGALVMGESLAINLHLARAHGGALGPADAVETARMEMWALWAATALEPSALAAMNVRGEGREGTPEGQAELSELRGRLRRPLQALEAHLHLREFMVGERFTVADVNTAEVVRYAQGERDLLAEHPGVERWLAACQARPAFRRMWEAREAEPVRP